jgi:hypothetical protein
MYNTFIREGMTPRAENATGWTVVDMARLARTAGKNAAEL